MQMNPSFKELLPRVNYVQNMCRKEMSIEKFNLIKPLVLELYKKLGIVTNMPRDKQSDVVINTYYNDCDALLTEIIKIIQTKH